MYIMHVDGSGDDGLRNSPTRYFVLSGLVVHELRWQASLDWWIDFRRRMREAFGLRLAEALHAATMINDPGALVRIRRNDRLAIVRAHADQLASMPDLSLINVVVDKSDKELPYDVLVVAWRALLQRFENTIFHRNFPGPSNPDERGMVFSDNTNNPKVTRLLRQRRRHNPVPNQPRFGIGYRNLVVQHVIEAPNFRDSRHSYFIQAADTAAYLLYQYIKPCAFMRRKGGHRYFPRLGPVPCRVASTADPHGIVWL